MATQKRNENRVSVRFPPEVLAELKRIAAEDKRSLNSEIIWIVEAAIRVAREAEHA